MCLKDASQAFFAHVVFTRIWNVHHKKGGENKKLEQQEAVGGRLEKS